MRRKKLLLFISKTKEKKRENEKHIPPPPFFIKEINNDKNFVSFQIIIIIFTYLIFELFKVKTHMKNK